MLTCIEALYQLHCAVTGDFAAMLKMLARVRVIPKHVRAGFEQEHFGFHMLSGKAETVMRGAKPPNGQTLRALISAGGIYASTSRGNFDLVDTFCGALTIRGTEDFLNAWATVAAWLALEIYCLWKPHRTICRMTAACSSSQHR